MHPRFLWEDSSYRQLLAAVLDFVQPWGGFKLSCFLFLGKTPPPWRPPACPALGPHLLDTLRRVLWLFNNEQNYFLSLLLMSLPNHTQKNETTDGARPITASLGPALQLGVEGRGTSRGAGGCGREQSQGCDGSLWLSLSLLHASMCVSVFPCVGLN